MNHTHRLIKKAKELDELLTVNYDEKSFRYKVDVDKVFYKEKGSYLKLELFGVGFTIEDACYDYLRKAHGGLMIHVISDKATEVI
jgi:hypothetical protein